MPIQPDGNPLIFNAKITSPGVQTLLSSGTLPLGLYRVQLNLYIDGTVAAATDDDNMKITINQSGLSGKFLGVPSTGQIVSYDFYAYADNVTIASGIAGTVGAIYHVNMVLTPQGVG